MKNIELLAPAKNLAQGIIAVNHGADAVYIAANRFGAREAAGNSLKDIEVLVKYAHQYRAKVYLAENTILYENELDAARQLAVDAYNIGCDALIIQDFAFLQMDLPPVPLFASTQMDNRTPEHVKFLENAGFDRVILARELSLQQIKTIRAATKIDLETFVHGALCVSYSGQCYLSCALTGRSANRGCCAQLCRSAYDLLDAEGKIIVKNKHLLSLRDLNLSAQLQNLIDAGVSSFKIEGRLKNAVYIKNVTAFYRQKIDEILNGNNLFKKSSSGTTHFFFKPNVDLSFARGFTDYFIDGRRKKMASIDTPKSIGEKIGVVVKINKNSFEIETYKTLVNGDGICFFDKAENLIGTKINRVDGTHIFPLQMNGILCNTIIYRSFNFAFEKEMARETSCRTISAKLMFTSNSEKIKIEAIDEDGVKIIIEQPQNGDIAKNAEKAIESIKENLSKTGNSIFTFDVCVDMPSAYFYTSAAINAWRRQAIELLTAKREKSYVRQQSLRGKFDDKIKNSELNYTANIANSLAEKFYKTHGAQQISKAFELSSEIKNAVLMFNKYCVRNELNLCHKGHNDDLFLINNGHRLRLHFDCEHCQMRVEACD